MQLSEPAALGWIDATILGIVEGLTEFLPVSSTGHLIVTNAILGRSDPVYEVAIQVGAISAIAFLYRQKLWRALLELRTASSRVNLWVLIVAAALPAAAVGLLFEETIDELLFNPTTVGCALIGGGVLLLLLEGWHARRGEAADLEMEAMTVRQALWIGVFQCLALIPGTSRSGATIAGALVMRFKRTAAAEFSFLVGLPILYGACLLKVTKDWERISGPLLGDFAIGCVASFLTAAAIVGPFVRFLQRHTFAVFAWYRIVAGAALLGAIAAGWL